MAWMELAGAFLFFFLSHSLPLRPSAKHRLVGTLGNTGFRTAYSALSVFALAWIIVAAGRAPYIELWAWQPWQSWVTLGLMLFASVLFCLTVGKPNPFSFGGTSNEQFDPERPGLVRWMRHPFLLVLAAWSIGHIIPNGNLAHVMVFSLFAGFAVFGQRLIDRRKQREMGTRWHELVEQVARQPVTISASAAIPFVLRAMLGSLLFVCALLLHQPVIGVSPIPY